jgi:hypothetical protein
MRGIVRAVALYLRSIRPIVGAVALSRQSWVRDMGVLLEDARHGSPSSVARSAGRIGANQRVVFRDARRQVEGLPVPPACVAVRSAFLSWLEKQDEACAIMIESGQTGDVRRLREVHGVLAEARAHAHNFNEEYARLVADVRYAVDNAARAGTPRRPRRRTA